MALSPFSCKIATTKTTIIRTKVRCAVVHSFICKNNIVIILFLNKYQITTMIFIRKHKTGSDNTNLWFRPREGVIIDHDLLVMTPLVEFT